MRILSEIQDVFHADRNGGGGALVFFLVILFLLLTPLWVLLIW